MIITVYIFALIGMVAGLVCLKNKKWSPGSWLIGLALVAVIGTSIQVGTANVEIFKFSDSFNKRVNTLSNRLDQVEVNVGVTNHTINIITNQIVNINNNITKVEREIVSIKDTLEGIYSRFRCETFRGSDTNKVVMFEKMDGGLCIGFVLRDCPILYSFDAIMKRSSSNQQIPLLKNSMHTVSNLLFVDFSGGSDRPTDAEFIISYTADLSVKPALSAIKLEGTNLVTDAKTSISLHPGFAIKPSSPE